MQYKPPSEIHGRRHKGGLKLDTRCSIAALKLEIANSCICSAIDTMLILTIQPFSYKNLCAHQLRGVGKLDGDNDDNASDDDVFCIVCPTHEPNKLPGGKMYLKIHPCVPTFQKCHKDGVGQDGESHMRCSQM